MIPARKPTGFWNHYANGQHIYSCAVPGCGWSFVTLDPGELQAEATAHRDAHKDAFVDAPAVEL